ncbi:phosphatidylglycerophosphatase A family protein [Aestuariivirga litoralis]|uniref:phosphatidylglycerophosphatase A family protein n=1 Tax=Aestuariivirga litoralis TaxID=2650924 RepID=UPI0018C5BC2D|nr:phosphatidylglycerophosphatase A [Aestuariivirga litoralis]
MSFGAGLAPFSPGTAGAIIALPIAWALWHAGLSVIGCLIVVFLLFLLGVACCSKAEERLGQADHPNVVWDETVAMLFILCFLPPDWSRWLVALVAFRFFDILKPWPIRLADTWFRHGWAIMIDDVFAAVPALALALLWPW